MVKLANAKVDCLLCQKKVALYITLESISWKRVIKPASVIYERSRTLSWGQAVHQQFDCPWSFISYCLMKHGIAFRNFSRTSYKMLMLRSLTWFWRSLRNLVTSLSKHERIKTKAQDTARLAEKVLIFECLCWLIVLNRSSLWAKKAASGRLIHWHPRFFLSIKTHCSHKIIPNVCTTVFRSSRRINSDIQVW